VDDFLVRASPPGGDAERQPQAACLMCEQQGFVYLTQFRWAGVRQLTWSCRSCGYVWIIPDRRVNGRI
jgi:hypothetical protein